MLSVKILSQLLDAKVPTAVKRAAINVACVMTVMLMAMALSFDLYVIYITHFAR